VIDDLEGQAAFDPRKAEQYRQLLEQFWEDSVSRYGLDNEQVRFLSQLLTKADSAEDR
jgi:hypothetical protein